ncbi:MAG: 7-carboxy-7-deazaguanine synthase QueE [Verrucomicrobia bacterium]|nr:MAG: 7-carboxy-7-deazaguanine synthase QueE [Verrucomicrobiota bacterium]
MKLAKLGDGPEIFHTIQGEGISAGMPAVFIRASRCNLHCVWCDTDYTWNFTGTRWRHEKDAQPGYAKFEKTQVTIEMEPAEIARRVLEYPCSRVVLTGGEPLLQQAEFLKVLELLRAERPDLQCEVETNGTQLPSEAFAAAVNQFNVSPKLANSGMAADLRLNAGVMNFFAKSNKAWFKFVIASHDDLLEVLDLTKQWALPLERVLLMPEGRTANRLDENATWLAEQCKQHGMRFSDRLHIRLWGERRGV